LIYFVSIKVSSSECKQLSTDVGDFLRLYAPFVAGFIGVRDGFDLDMVTLTSYKSFTKIISIYNN
jgi:hypothetical protein